MLEIIMQKTIYGTERPILKYGLVKGRNKLIADGFRQCENKIYFQKNEEFWHYNRLSKCWYKD